MDLKAVVSGLTQCDSARFLNLVDLRLNLQHKYLHEKLARYFITMATGDIYSLQIIIYSTTCIIFQLYYI